MARRNWGLAKPFTLTLSLILASAVAGALYSAFVSDKPFTSIVEELSRLEFKPETILVHNIWVLIAPTLPYYAIAALALATRFRVFRLARLVAALAPLPVAILNGIFVGGVAASPTLASIVVPGWCPEPLDKLVILSLLIPHGVFEIPSAALLLSTPLALEKTRNPVLAAATYMPLGFAGLAVAAYVEVYITPLAYKLALTLCSEFAG